MALYICSAIFGMVIAIISAYLLISFDNRFLKFLLSLADIGSGGLVVIFHKYYKVYEQKEKLWSTSIFYLSFIVFLLLFLYLICLLIKDKNDKDLLRIRDILLGQQDYIVKYYEARKTQINEKLQIPLLEERERKVKSDEEAIEIEKGNIDRSKALLAKQGKRKIKIKLPERKEVYISQEFIDEMPSYFDGFSNCISAIDQYTSKELKNNSVKSQEVLNAFLINIETNVLSSLFGNSSQVRVHFRKYNPENNTFEMISAVTGKQGKPIFVKRLSPIPYENSLIEKSYQCKRAIIKSVNPYSTKYNGDNCTVWQDYITYTFYNVRYKGKPCLSFGISVQNAERYRDIFYFLNYAKFEMYLNSSIDRFDEVVGIASVLYDKKDSRDYGE